MWRVICAGGLFAAGLYIVVGEHFVGVSADATVNARYTTLRAPIDGTLALSVKTIGARLIKSERLGEVEDVRADQGRLIDLLRIDVSHSAELRKYGAQRKSISAAKTILAGHADTYKSGRVRQLEARLREANATIEAARSRYREVEAAYLRAKDLSARGVQTAALFEKAQSNYETSQKDIEVADQKIAFLTVELESARNGTFLGDSYNDAPYSTQRIRELDLRLDEIDAEIGYLRERQSQVQSQINEENVRLSRMTGAEITSPASGLVWDYRAENGETVQRGQELLRVVDCDTVIVSASVSERLYNRLKTGDAAQFRLLGDDVVYNATIMRLAGSGAQTRYESFAIGATPEHLTRYDVTLSSPAFTEKGGLDCAVGRTGRVIFSAGPLSQMRHLLFRMGW